MVVEINQLYYILCIANYLGKWTFMKFRGISYTCGLDCCCLLISGAMLGLCLGVSMASYSRFVVNEVYLISILSGAPFFELHCTRSVQFGGIVPSIMNGTVED